MRLIADAGWAVCAWIGATVLLFAAWLAGLELLDRVRDAWRHWRTLKCRYCDVTIAHGVYIGGREVPLCDECAAAWMLRRMHIPREAMG